MECHFCGETIARPSDSDLCPNCGSLPGKGLVEERPSDPHYFGQSSQPSFEVYTPPTSSFSPSKEPSLDTPVRKPKPWIVKALAVVAIVVVMAAILPRVAMNTSQPEDSGPMTGPSALAETGSDDPGSNSGSTQPWYFYYEFGDESIPRLEFVLDKAPVFDSQSRTDGETSVLIVHYPQPAPTSDVLLAYAIWMRAYSGFILGPVERSEDRVSGTMWRNSIDAGQVIRIQFESDPGGYTITLKKGPISVATDEGFPKLEEQPSEWPSPGPSLTFQSSAGWMRYETWQHSSLSVADHHTMTYVKTVMDSLVGTMNMTKAHLGLDESLMLYSNRWVTNFHPQEPLISMGPPTALTVDGMPAFSYTGEWNDTQFSYLFILVGEQVFTVMSSVDMSSSQNPGADIQSMLDSIRIQP